MAEPPSIPIRSNPHVRLNSGQDDLLINDSATTRPSQPVRQISSRSLTSQLRPQTSTSIRDPGLTNLYGLPGPQESAQSLLQPSSKSRIHRFRDEESLPGSPTHSHSRRTSWSSFHDPFVDGSRAPSRAGSDEENVNTQTVAEKYNIMPSNGLLLFPEDVENDDYLHNPDPNEDNKRECDIFTKRGLVNVGGLSFITLCILVLFIGFPILTFVRRFTDPPDPCKTNSDCIGNGKAPFLKNVRTSLIDPDTPQSAHTKKVAGGKEWKLTFSDEFNTPGRSFYPGDDPYWTAVDLWYGVTMDMEWYDPDAVTTRDGTLELRFDAFAQHGTKYRSGMVQSWNKTCFTGGMLEASISLPGRGDTVGFWPGFWSMGNLGRPGYAATTEGLWPYSYNSDKCDAGITANQSQTDGISYLPGMRLPACTCEGEDHPSPGRSRSAPEIDVIEASVVDLVTGSEARKIGGVSQSCQIAPFDIWYQPNTEFMEFYDPSVTSLNTYQGAPFQQAMSGMSNLNNDWYDGKEYQKYAFQYKPGPKGEIIWSIGDIPTWKLDARAIGPNGNIGQRVIPEEPMAMVMNFGMADGFSFVNITGLLPLMPAKMRFDYVRIYQDPDASDQFSMSCDPPDFPTLDYIARHDAAYSNPELTSWKAANKTWPKNTLVDGCKLPSDKA